MVNSSFKSKSAKDAVNEVNSKGASVGGSDSFAEKAMREMEYFSEYVTGGLYSRSKLKREIHRLTDKEEEPRGGTYSTWKNYFSGETANAAKNAKTFDHDESDLRPKVYLGIFSVIIGLGLVEIVALKARKMRVA